MFIYGMNHRHQPSFKGFTKFYIVRKYIMAHTVTKRSNKTVKEKKIEEENEYIKDLISGIERDKPNYYLYYKNTTNHAYFERIVNEIINIGYIPIGGIFIDDMGVTYQVLIRQNFIIPPVLTSNPSPVTPSPTPSPSPREIPGQIPRENNRFEFEIGGKKTIRRKYKKKKIKKSRRRH